MLPGIHHVTAITSDAQKNVDFYTGILGLRLVKVTVNFDDPASYHLYYGDELGRPGTILTFFAWPGAQRGRIGAPQVTTTAFAIPAGSLEFWAERSRERKIPVTNPRERFGERTIALVDPDGMQLELIESAGASSAHAWKGGGVPVEHAIRGFHGVTISEEGYEHTARLLTQTMGFRATASEANRFRYEAAADSACPDSWRGASPTHSTPQAYVASLIADDTARGRGAHATAMPATVIDLLCVPGGRNGGLGAGVVHHVAFRTPDEAQQLAWRGTLVAGGFNVSPVMDRNYFHSIYYREPGGVLFEIATDTPGFTVDETADQLGNALKLPRQYEPLRRELEGLLPPIKR